MIAFYCATPYHILVSVNMMLNEHKGQPADIYVLNYFDGAKEMVDRLNQCGLFRRAVFIPVNNYTLYEKIKRFVHVFLPDVRIRQMMRRFDYQVFYFFALDFLNISYIIKKAMQKRVPCRFCYGEDGIGSYIKDIYVPSETVSKLLNICGRTKYLQEIREMYVYAPELVVANRNFRPMGLKKFNHHDPELARVCSVLWPHKADLKGRVLYFQQPLNERNGIDLSSIERQLIEEISTVFGADRFSIKLHPRTQNPQDFPQSAVIKSTVPFEIYALNFDFSRHLLVSAISTASFAPFLLLGQYPDLIFTYRLYGEGVVSIGKTFGQFMEKFISGYEEKGRILIPETLEEYRQCIAECSRPSDDSNDDEQRMNF